MTKLFLEWNSITLFAKRKKINEKRQFPANPAFLMAATLKNTIIFTTQKKLEIVFEELSSLVHEHTINIMHKQYVNPPKQPHPQNRPKIKQNIYFDTTVQMRNLTLDLFTETIFKQQH